MVILSSEALYDDTACSLTCGRRPANQAIIEVARDEVVLSSKALEGVGERASE